MAEDYVRPPVVAFEAPSRRAAERRFRITLILVLIALAIGISFIVKLLIDTSENGNAQAAPKPMVSISSVRR